MPAAPRPLWRDPRLLLAAICLGAFALRLLALQFVSHPGIADPVHYYNLGLRLHEGHGFTIDYVWNYFNPPDAVVHPEDHWMPLSAVLVAGSFAILGVSVWAALLPFMLIGSLLPVLGYAAARQFNLGDLAALFCAAGCAALPEFVLNSLRTDTTIPNTFLLCAAVLLAVHGIRRGGWGWFVLAGGCAGLSYLTRNDGLLILAALPALALLHPANAPRRRIALLLLVPLAGLLTASPWLLRNLTVFGSLTASGTSDMFFYTDVLDHWAYGRDFTLETMLAAQTIPQLLGKRLFELAAAFKLMYTTLDVFLPVALAGGALLIVAERDWGRLRALAPAMTLLAIILVAYPLLIPLKSQAGSFKKAYLSLIPLLLPLAAYALERAIAAPRLRAGAAALAIAFLAANAVELVRADARFTNQYDGNMARAATMAAALPDTNGDSEIILMAQDPLLLAYHHISSVMLPMESRETILAAAQRYGVDYLLMPPDRPALDPIYLGQEDDPRFVLAQEVAGTNFRFYRLRP